MLELSVKGRVPMRRLSVPQEANESRARAVWHRAVHAECDDGREADVRSRAGRCSMPADAKVFGALPSAVFGQGRIGYYCALDDQKLASMCIQGDDVGCEQTLRTLRWQTIAQRKITNWSLSVHMAAVDAAWPVDEGGAYERDEAVMRLAFGVMPD